MFYQAEMDKALRFGDVLKGFVLTAPNIEGPIVNGHDHSYSIDVNIPKFSVVLSPCCSIRDKIITLTPFISLRPKFFLNPYFTEDFTRINRKMKPEQVFPPEEWVKLSAEQRVKRLAEGEVYAFFELFVFEKNDLFPKDIIHRKEGDKETNFYMIDFRNTFKINCDKIITPENSPLDSKCLQLSVQARQELRNKITAFYGNIPAEDKALL